MSIAAILLLALLGMAVLTYAALPALLVIMSVLALAVGIHARTTAGPRARRTNTQ